MHWKAGPEGPADRYTEQRKRVCSESSAFFVTCHRSNSGNHGEIATGKRPPKGAQTRENSRKVGSNDAIAAHISYEDRWSVGLVFTHPPIVDFDLIPPAPVPHSYRDPGAREI